MENCYNAATLISNGRRVATYYKQRLPNYEVFDEERYFESGDAPCVVTINGLRCGINICADVWEAGAADLARDAGCRDSPGAQRVALSHRQAGIARADVLRERIAATGLPVVYANLVGGQDELVFDGGSFALDSKGEIRCQLPKFEEALGIVEVVDGEPLPGRHRCRLRVVEEEVYQRAGAWRARLHRQRTVSRARSSACRAASIRR